jgi:HEAT repeat protein
VGPLKKHLDQPGAEARRDALWALGQIGDASAAETVARDIYSELPDVRSAASDAAGRLGATNAKELVDALRVDYYRRVRESAGRASRKLDVAAEANK